MEFSWGILFEILSIYSQHVKITFVDKAKQEPHYLRPTAWASAKRWSSHADMIGNSAILQSPNRSFF